MINASEFFPINIYINILKKNIKFFVHCFTNQEKENITKQITAVDCGRLRKRWCFWLSSWPHRPFYPGSCST